MSPAVLRASAVLLAAACLSGQPAAARAATELADQRALSRAAGRFSPSRHLVYDGSDTRFHHFRERGKFGPLGPSGRFRIPVHLIDLGTAPVGAIFTYDQNSGTFMLWGEGISARRIEADFVETHTREEERHLEASARLAKLAPSASGRDRAAATAEAMFAAFRAGHPGDAERHAKDVIAMDARDELHGAFTVLGVVAVERGDLAGGERALAASIERGATPVMASFGPNMRLAQALLRAGRTEPVLRYLEACAAFWKAPSLPAWQRDIRAGREPDFGANLHYGLR